MSVIFTDTHPDAERVLVDMLRQTPAWRKLEMVGQLNQTVRTLALSGLRQRFPEATSLELRRRLADILLGPELAVRVYGPMGFHRESAAQLDLESLRNEADQLAQAELLSDDD